MHDDMM